MLTEAGKIHVYVDETGDRGSARASSPIFGMSAVVVDEPGARDLRQAVAQLRMDFKVPAGQVMSWKNHVKTHDRRHRAAALLLAVQGMQVCYVYAVKSKLRDGSYRDDPQRFYNFVAYRTYKSALWAARSMAGPAGWRIRLHRAGLPADSVATTPQQRIVRDTARHHADAGLLAVDAG